MTSHTVLIAPGPFGAAMSAERVASAIGRGLSLGGPWEPDLCPISVQGDPAGVRGLLAAVDFDVRMRRARAVVVADVRLDRSLPNGGAAFEIATRARQSGVPAYGIVARDGHDLFEARILDLQVILEAASAQALPAAGRALAKLI